MKRLQQIRCCCFWKLKDGVSPAAADGAHSLKFCLKQSDALWSLGCDRKVGWETTGGRGSAKYPVKPTLKPDLLEGSKEGKWPKQTILPK